MKYEFTDDFLVGIDSIDTEHRHLFELTNTAYDLVHDQFRSDKYDQIVAIMNELRDYAKNHFSHEEDYMEQICYRRRWSQKIQHREFIKKLDSIDLKHMDANQQAVLLDIVEFLASWLIGHIKGSDKNIC